MDIIEKSLGGSGVCKLEDDKHVVIHEETVTVLPDSDEKNSNNSTTSKLDKKKLMRKIDWAIIPWVSILYLLSFLDRTSIGNARVC